MTLTVVGTLAFDTLGEVERLPEREETGGVRKLEADARGGTAGNVAMALARLGLRARVLAGVGSDFAGSAYERALIDAGVDLSLLVRSQDEPTSRAYIFYDGHGHQTTFFFAGASREVGRRAPPRLDGRAHFAAGEISAYPALMERAGWVSFDPGQEIFHRELREVVACFDHVDVLFLNRHERRTLEERAAVAVRDILARGVAAIVETRGADGAILHEPSGETRIPAAPAEARDPTGAGDAHRAGFLYALDKGAPLDEAARFAGVMGAFAVEAVGPQAGLPTISEATARFEAAYGRAPAFR